MKNDSPSRGRPPSLTREMTTRIAAAVRDGDALASAAAMAGVAPATLNYWLASGRRNPAGRYGNLAGAVDAATYLRRGVAFIRWVQAERKARRILMIPLEGAALAHLPRAMRRAIEHGEMVPTEVSVRFERAEAT